MEFEFAKTETMKGGPKKVCLRVLEPGECFKYSMETHAYMDEDVRKVVSVDNVSMANDSAQYVYFVKDNNILCASKDIQVIRCHENGKTVEDETFVDVGTLQPGDAFTRSDPTKKTRLDVCVVTEKNGNKWVDGNHTVGYVNTKSGRIDALMATCRVWPLDVSAKYSLREERGE